MNKYKENVYKNLFEYPTKKIVELELKNEQLENENQQLKKQKDDVVEYIKKHIQRYDVDGSPTNLDEFDILASPKTLLRMLGDNDENK